MMRLSQCGCPVAGCQLTLHTRTGRGQLCAQPKQGHGLFREPKALDPLQGWDTLHPVSQARHGPVEILAPPGDGCGHNLPARHKEGAPVGKRGAPPACGSGPRVGGAGGELRPDQTASALRPLRFIQDVFVNFSPHHHNLPLVRVLNHILAPYDFSPACWRNVSF